jgi:phage baseplate assembly protein W
MPTNLPDQPHFRYPFRFGNGVDKHALVNEQDSEDDVMACVYAIIKTDRGWRDDLPEFGIVPQIFDEQPLKVDDVKAALDQWEERASYKVTTEQHFRERLAAVLRVEVRSR